MLKTPDWSKGEIYLLENAPELEPLIKRFSPCTLKVKKNTTIFPTLVQGIIAQQLSPEISNSIFKKIEIEITNITPKNILALSNSFFEKQGLTLQKAIYLKDFAQMIVDGKLTIDKFDEMSDNEIKKQLLQVKGLGQWTIEMTLLLALCRPDIAPAADHIFAKEIKELFNLEKIPKRGQINKLTKHWQPWRSLAVWYLWQNSDSKALAKGKN
jgi:DNA-3-methyladenine glycosylase II